MPLLLAATPIGNIGDATERLREALETADIIAAEDTRRLQRLTSSLGVRPIGRIVSFFDSVEAGRTAALLESLREGLTVLVVSDAGMPLVSDPGYRLVAAAVSADLPVTVLPGPSAVTAAVALSGLAVERFCFEGFLPRRAGDRRRRIAELAADSRALVCFEAPHRLAVALADLAAGFGSDRAAAVCRELTKTHEEVRRDTLGGLAQWAAESPPRGEITIVIAGASDVVVAMSPADLKSAVDALIATGLSRRDAVAQVAETSRTPKRDVYAAATSRAAH